MPSDRCHAELDLLEFVPKDYRILGLKNNPFPSIPLCILNTASPLYGEITNRNIGLLCNRIRQSFDSSSRNRCIFIGSSPGVGKTTFLLGLARSLEKSKEIMPIFTRYTPGGLQKLYHYSLCWIGLDKFARAYSFCVENPPIRKEFDRFFSNIAYFIKTPEKAFTTILRTTRIDILSSILVSVIKMVCAYANREHCVLIIDNIEHMWDCMTTTQKVYFLFFLFNLLSEGKGKIMVVMPLPSKMDKFCRSRCPKLEAFVDFDQRVFSLQSGDKESLSEIFESYLANARVDETQGGSHPFTEEAVVQIFDSNRGLISGVLLDAFNIIESVCRRRLRVIEKPVVREYYAHFLKSPI